MSLMDDFAKFQTGEMKDYQLRQSVTDENIRLQVIAQQVDADSSVLMTVKGLAGDTMAERQQSFTEASAVLRQAEQALIKHDEFLKDAGERKDFAPLRYKKEEPEVRILSEEDAAAFNSGEGIGFYGEQIMKSAQFQELHDAVLRQDIQRATFKVRRSLGNPTLRHVTSTPAGEGILQGQRVVAPIRPPTRLLEAAGVEQQPGANYIVFHRVVRTNSAGTRDAETAVNIATVDPNMPRSPLHFQSIGVIAGVQREYIGANSNILPRVADALMYDLEQTVDEQATTGNQAAPNWSGLQPQLAAMAAQVQAVPAVSAANRGAHTWLRGQVGEMIDTGVNPNLIIVNRTTADLLFAQIFENQTGILNPDYRGMNGEVMVRGLPVWVSPNMAANTAFIGEFNPATIRIVTQQDIEVSFSNEVYFGSNQVAVRVLIYGNLALYDPLRFRLITGTDRLKNDNTAGA